MDQYHTIGMYCYVRTSRWFNILSDRVPRRGSDRAIQLLGSSSNLPSLSLKSSNSLLSPLISHGELMDLVKKKSVIEGPIRAIFEPRQPVTVVQNSPTLSASDGAVLFVTAFFLLVKSHDSSSRAL